VTAGADGDVLKDPSTGVILDKTAVSAILTGATGNPGVLVSTTNELLSVWLFARKFNNVPSVATQLLSTQ